MRWFLGWVASNPFLSARARLRDFGVVADIAVLIDISIDRLRRAATAAVENGLSSQHSDAIVI